MSLNRPAVKISGVAVLASLSVILQVLPPLFLTPWFMRIDLVAVPWVLCWILFGFDSALLCLVVSVPIVGLLGPFAGGWVGATMKSVSSVWMFTIPALFFMWNKLRRDDKLDTEARRSWLYRTLISPAVNINKRLYVAASITALSIRAFVTVLFNFYFALPVFFGLTADQIISFFSAPTFLSFVGHSLGLVGLGAFVVEIAFWNTLQGIIDLYVAFAVGLIILERVPGFKE